MQKKNRPVNIFVTASKSGKHKGDGFFIYAKCLRHKFSGIVLYAVGKIISWVAFCLKKVIAMLQKYKL